MKGSRDRSGAGGDQSFVSLRGVIRRGYLAYNELHERALSRGALVF